MYLLKPVLFCVNSEVKMTSWATHSKTKGEGLRYQVPNRVHEDVILFESKFLHAKFHI